MRLVKILFSALSIAVMLLTVEIVMRLPNDAEVALVGAGADRSDLAQMRLARLILAVDPERGSRALASITATDPALVEANLRLIARLDVEMSESAAEDPLPFEKPVPGYADPVQVRGGKAGEAAADEAPRVRVMPDGGARFVRVN